MSEFHLFLCVLVAQLCLTLRRLFLRLYNIPVSGFNLLIHSSVDGQNLGFFHLLVSLSHAAINIGGQASIRILVFYSLLVWCPTLATTWTVALWAPLFMGFSRQDYWSGLPLPSPGDLPDPRIDPEYPALQADSLPTEL